MKKSLLLAGLGLCVVLALQNTGGMSLHILFWKLTLQKGLFILLFLVLGFILDRLAKK